MDQTELDVLHDWFDGYVRTFSDIDAADQPNIQLKIEHTRKVCAVMSMLAAGEGLSREDGLIASAVALLHDVGRFTQFRRWRTFRDSDSDNHARIAIEVIRAERLLAGLPPLERLMIEEAVRFHNLLNMPVRLKSPTDRFLRLIRDADKLDIWRVFVDQFNAPETERASAALLGFPHVPQVSPACLLALREKRIVNLENVASVNDFRLLLISWVYNLNYKTSYRLLCQNGYIIELAEGIDEAPGVREAIDAALEHVEFRAGNGTMIKDHELKARS